MIRQVYKTLYLTRGDSMLGEVLIKTYQTEDGDDIVFVPGEGDTIRFALTKEIGEEPILVKTVDTETMTFTLDPADTEELEYGEYQWDIKLTTEDGTVNTFVDRGKLILTEVVA